MIRTIPYPEPLGGATPSTVLGTDAPSGAPPSASSSVAVSSVYATPMAAMTSGGKLRPKGQQSIPPHDRLLLHLPGGGGIGDPSERDPAQVAEDVRNGLVSKEAAERDYGN